LTLPRGRARQTCVGIARYKDESLVTFDWLTASFNIVDICETVVEL